MKVVKNSSNEPVESSSRPTVDQDLILWLAAPVAEHFSPKAVLVSDDAIVKAKPACVLGSLDFYHAVSFCARQFSEAHHQLLALTPDKGRHAQEIIDVSRLGAKLIVLVTAADIIRRFDDPYDEIAMAYVSANPYFKTTLSQATSAVYDAANWPASMWVTLLSYGSSAFEDALLDVFQENGFMPTPIAFKIFLRNMVDKANFPYLLDLTEMFSSAYLAAFNKVSFATLAAAEPPLLVSSGGEA